MAYDANANVNDGNTYVDSGTTPGSGAQLLREGGSLYTSSFADIASYQHRDVTEQIIRYNQLYGGSDNTQQGGLAASKSLNYVKAPTIQRALRVNVTAIPFTFTFTGQVGLFGAENAYIAINLDIQNTTNARKGVVVNDYTTADVIYTLDQEQEVNDYYPAVVESGCNIQDPEMTPEQNDLYNDYCKHTPGPCALYNACGENGRILNVGHNKGCNGWFVNLGDSTNYYVNCYDNAEITDVIPNLSNPKVSVRLDNRGTGNIYIDTWLDTMLYERDQQMWGYDTMYVNPRDIMYVGFHARNTRHLPYNVTVTIGEEFLDSGEIAEKELISTSTLIY